MEFLKFFKKTEKEIPVERGIEAEPRKEVIARWQGKRAEKLREILISRTVDTVGNYIPGIDVVKMTTEAVIGRTSSKKELPPVERIAYVLCSALILGFYITGNPAIRLGASAVFDVIMLPRMFKAVVGKIGDIVPQVGSLLDASQGFIIQHKAEALKALTEILATASR
jgi:hypothetical protein